MSPANRTRTTPPTRDEALLEADADYMCRILQLRDQGRMTDDAASTAWTALSEHGVYVDLEGYR